MSTKSDIPTKGNILVVDDHADNLRVLSSMLSQQGYKVRKALSGEMALMACQVNQPDLILLDINMPGMDGYQVCQHLKSLEKTCEIPIIFISVLDSALDKVRAFNMGGVDYITKPFQLEEVVARVENQLIIQRLKLRLQEKIASLKTKMFYCYRKLNDDNKLKLPYTQQIKNYKNWLP